MLLVTRKREEQSVHFRNTFQRKTLWLCPTLAENRRETATLV